MTFATISFQDWLAIVLVLFAAMAYAQQPPEELLVPDERQRSWRRMLRSRQGRLAREAAGEAEANQFIRDLSDPDARPAQDDHAGQVLLPMPQPGRHRAPEPVPGVIKIEDLPRFRPTVVLRDPSEPRPPWEAPEPEPRPLDTWAPGDFDEPPTIIRKEVLPAIKGDLLKYLDELHKYKD